MSGGAPRGRDDGGHRRVGALVAAVPVVLFALSVLFIVVRRPAGDRCRHHYGVERVRQWWREARREEVSVPGTRYLAFDDSLGCIHVGLEDRRARTHLERRFRRLGVPRDVVVYEVVEGAGTKP